jgi:putative Mg2+ transporter-C (MgtC) family protein
MGDLSFISDAALKLGVALLLGALMGAEREYKGRNIGFRTVILITLGSTLFTIISVIMGGEKDAARIASNIVTGVGFLGAGAIFRDGFTVKGVTTASLIWVSAAIGMACGIGHFEFAAMVTFLVLVVLIGFTGMQRFIDRYNKELIYKITLQNDPLIRSELEKEIVKMGLSFEITNLCKTEGCLHLSYEIRGSIHRHEVFTNYLTLQQDILKFEV